MMETFLFSSPKFLSYAYIILAPDDTFDLGTIANVGIPADTSMSCGFRGRSSNVNFRNITHTAKAVPKIKPMAAKPFCPMPELSPGGTAAENKTGCGMSIAANINSRPACA